MNDKPIRPMVIWKYELTHACTTLQLPGEFRFLHAAQQGDAIRLWFAVQEGEPVTEQTFRMIGTGQNVEPELLNSHLGTVLVSSHVFHIFGPARLQRAVGETNWGGDYINCSQNRRWTDAFTRDDPRQQSSKTP